MKNPSGEELHEVYFNVANTGLPSGVFTGCAVTKFNR